MLDWTNEDSLIPRREVVKSSRSPKGFSSINQPEFLKSNTNKYYYKDQRIIGVNYNGIAKSYPIRILNWHQVVNDYFGDKSITISYCLFCGSGIAFEAQFNGKALTFYPSGLFFNNEELLLDNQTQSLWSPLLGISISGPLKGQKLIPIPCHNTTFSEWKTRFPTSLILKPEMEFVLHYQNDPYDTYRFSDDIFYPVKWRSDRFHPKDKVLGVEIEGHYKAYPFSELRRTKNEVVEDSINGVNFFVVFDKQSNTALAVKDCGEELPAITLYWFAWYGFHPDTVVFKASW